MFAYLHDTSVYYMIFNHMTFHGLGAAFIRAGNYFFITYNIVDLCYISICALLSHIHNLCSDIRYLCGVLNLFEGVIPFHRTVWSRKVE